MASPPEPSIEDDSPGFHQRMIDWGHEHGANPALLSFAQRLAMDDRAQTSNIGGLFIGILIAVIIGVAVAIPVINDVTAEANITGTEATVVELLPLFIGLILLVALAGPLMRRVN